MTRRRASRLFDRAARRAQEGEHERVAALCRRALSCQPSLHAARRELARVYVETGDRENARATLWQAILVDARDTWSLVTLASLLLQNRRPDQADSLTRIALRVEAANPQALDVLGQALLAAGREADALGTFGQALLINPELSQPRLGTARALLAQGRAEESSAVLEALLAGVEETDRPASVFGQARELYVEVQEALMTRNLGQAREAVETFRRSLQARDGVPILVRYFDDVRQAAWAEVSWTNQRDYHVVGCCGSVPEPVKLHLLAHELMHLQLESEAREAGKLRRFTVGQEHAWSDLFAVKAHELRRQGFDPRQINQNIVRAAEWCGNLLCNIPIDMLVESRLRGQMPVLSPAQFRSMRYYEGRLNTVDQHPELRLTLPRSLLRAAMALAGAFAIFADHLHPGATQFSAPYRPKPSFAVSQELFAFWTSRFPHLGPGDHYALVEEFAARLGMQGMFEWRAVPTARQDDLARNQALAA